MMRTITSFPLWHKPSGRAQCKLDPVKTGRASTTLGRPSSLSQIYFLASQSRTQRNGTYCSDHTLPFLHTHKMSQDEFISKRVQETMVPKDSMSQAEFISKRVQETMVPKDSNDFGFVRVVTTEKATPQVSPGSNCMKSVITRPQESFVNSLPMKSSPRDPTDFSYADATKSMTSPKNGERSLNTRDLALLQVERRQLYIRLKMYERMFESKHDRKVSSNDDIAPVAKLYARYHAIKGAVRQLKIEHESLRRKLIMYEAKFEQQHGRKVALAADMIPMMDEYRRLKRAKTAIAAMRSADKF